MFLDDCRQIDFSNELSILLFPEVVSLHARAQRKKSVRNPLTGKRMDIFFSETAISPGFTSCIECSLKYLLKVSLEESIVNAPRVTDQITDQLFKSNLTSCVVCVFTMLTIDCS
jgi:hypothetical protein